MPARPPQKLTPPRDIKRMSEDQWQAEVVQLAGMFGWKCTHFYNMRMNEEGFPDLLIMRSDEYILAELKTERGSLNAAQKRWHMHASLFGITVHVWRPRHYRDAVRVLGAGFDVTVEED